IHPDDVVCCEQAFFFEVKPAARRVYDTCYSSVFFTLPMAGGKDFTPEEKRAMSVLVIRPEKAEFLTRFFGGQWQAVSAPFGDTQDLSRLARVPMLGKWLVKHCSERQTERHQVQVF